MGMVCREHGYVVLVGWMGGLEFCCSCTALYQMDEGGGRELAGCI